MPLEAGVSVEMNRIEAVMKQVTELSKLQVLVGFPAATASRSGEPINNASLAYVMEHGSPARNIPARPFLGPAGNAMQDRAVAMLRQAADLQLHEKPAEARNALDALGLAAQAAVKNKIVSGPFVPNAPSTIERKGSDKPLIDKAQMLNAVNYVVRRKG
jgi:hypothetical protein